MSTMKLVIFTLLVGAIMAEDADTDSTAAPPDPPASEAPTEEVVVEANWQDFNGRSFAYVPKLSMWADAQKHCVALGGSLASIDSSQEDDFAKVLSMGQRAWIGFSDAQIDGTWLWINSDNSTYTGWCTDKPDNAGGHQHCAVMHFSEDKCWDNEDCHTPYGSICTKG